MPEISPLVPRNRSERRQWGSAGAVPGWLMRAAGAKGRPGPSPAEASSDAGQRNVILIYVPRLGNKPKGTCASSWWSLGSLHKGDAFQLNLKDKVFLKKSNFSNLCWNVYLWFGYFSCFKRVTSVGEKT